ncbi:MULTISPECIES: NAD(P)H oxidoreductase [Streptomyces]|uniref:NAD(P)H oxidoreductase YRKL @ putative NADPH-quinone reductase (Modulator of drug activity B) @ Flavodoxin 2 n=4 Tax=Streptomyces venezuelae TaxID=54571 RepID=F2R106_STRVP|nr:NAD(P)H oxidoreductase [Streptomyces venezuelae]APE21488.1 NADPH oxidoreductase [Streptomyces venezuelae]QER98875.1 NAD(P)H oxidoreductase [Streptomyces venezuelae ATCC 10712]CCA55523.1 NAD(P)H oxidoreductase YRKL @ putative NADPH-quinone reductase (modulator of drug activity B) @ Flavodoxin 2 [Streptomyces venezuelae ATCC 10712]
MARHTLLVLAHPRSDSLTAQVAARLHARLKDEGGTVDVLDLYAEGFDPVLRPEDEPDWENREKVYSPVVHAHMDRVLAADDVLVVFPVWWFTPPAILKGWIDRVWNYGFAYGRSRPRLAGKRLLWLALMGGTPEEIERLGMTEALGLMLVTGISAFCGLPDASLRVLHGTELSGVPAELRADRVAELLDQAERTLTEELLTPGATEAPGTPETPAAPAVNPAPKSVDEEPAR